MNEKKATDNMTDDDDELIEIIEDDEVAAPNTVTAEPARRRPWLVLIVDDDEDVHESSSFALRGVEILERPLELIHAYSGNEGLEALQRNPDIAVALVDVVMEQEDAGLLLVEKMRSAGFNALRIVLRTGQPGYAPQLDVLARYDINDYRTKSELDRTRLMSVITTGVRAYRQLRQLEENRRGLELIVASTAALFNRGKLVRFSRGVLTQLAALIGVPSCGLVAVASPSQEEGAVRYLGDFEVISDSGRFDGTTGQSLEMVADEAVRSAFLSVHIQKMATAVNDGVAMRFHGGGGQDLFVYLETTEQLNEATLSLIEVFASNIAVCFENVDLLRKLDELAFVDLSLGVPNENAFERCLADTIEHDPELFVVGLISIEDLDSMTSTFGPGCTQQVLRGFYNEIWTQLGSLQAVARVGDDVFAFLAMAPGPDQFARKRLFARSYDIDSGQVMLTGTVALVQLEPEESDVATIMRRARSTLVHARLHHPGELAHYDPRIVQEIEQRVRLQTALGSALRTGEGFSVYVQPKIDVARRCIIGGEALSRWRLEGNDISPSSFIPVAEACGLSTAIMTHVVEQLGRWVKRRRLENRTAMLIAVNFSMFDVQQPGFSERLLKQLETLELTPADISFEMTESGMMRDPDRIVAELSRIVDAGYSLAIDDFGTGYSSLAQLDRLPVDVLKIDRAFISSLTAENARSSIAAASVAMAQSLGLKIVAEGIETQEQHQASVFLGCHEGQGYLYGKAVPIELFDDTYDNWDFQRASAA